MRGHNVPDGAGVLPAIRFRRKSDFVRFDFDFTDRVLSAAGRNYSAYVFGRSSAGKISALHHDHRNFFDMGDGLRAQRPF